MKKAIRVLLVVGLCLAGKAFPLHGQAVQSEIIGTVKDPSGAAIPGAKVIASRVETQGQRSDVTDNTGSYRIAGLDPGTYNIRVQHPGFKTTEWKAVVLLVNQHVVLDFILQLGAIEQQVVVSGQVPMLQTTTSEMSGVVTGSQLRELPLNGRDLFQLVALQPGVYPTTNAGPSPWSEGGITKAAVQGTRPTMNNITQDGGDINDFGFNIPVGGAAGVQLGVEAVREFRVLLNSYSAEFGRNAGANVQLVTRSGSNDFHGSVLEFHRNAVLDARNFFDGRSKPAFNRNQFGASLGGPIVRNKAFFFVDYEGLRERKGITVSTTVPDDNAHAGLLPSASDPNTLVNVGVDPRVAPFLALFPRANGPSLGGGLAVLNASGKQPTREDYGVLRVDYSASPVDEIFGRYVIDDSNSTVPFQSTLIPGFPGERITRSQYFMLSWQRIIANKTLNEAKFNYNRTRYVAMVANQFPLSISLVQGRPLGSIAISGLPSVGNNLIFPLGATGNTFEFIDNLSNQRGRHDVKFGTDIKRLQVNGPFDLFIDGDYVFTDLTAFGFPAQSNNPALEFFLAGDPFLYLGVDPKFADSVRGYRQTYLSAYVQDDWHVRPNLTLNLGIRWEYWSNPTEANGRIANIRDVVRDTAPTVGRIFNNVSKAYFSPRVGFAWSPHNSRTVVRGGFGLFRDQLWEDLYDNTRFYEPFYKALLFVFPQFQAPPSSVNSIVGLGGPASVIGSFGTTFHQDFPYYLAYNLNVQRELAPNLLLQVGYVGGHGVHLPRTGEANPFIPSLGQNLNPNFGSIPLLVTDANSSYNSLQVSVQKRFASGLSFQSSYTFSRSIDTQSGPFPSDYVSESGVSQDFFNPKGDRGRSSFDRKHVWVFNFLYDFPFGPGHHWGGNLHGLAGTLATGWRIGGVSTLMSNTPFTANLGSFNNSETFASNPADRPNVKPGANPCGSSVTRHDPNRWFDPSIFTLPPSGQFGNAGRNILCGPNLRNFDFTLTKQTKVSDRISTEFRVEFFNILNRPNFDVPVNTQGPNGSGGNGDQIFVGRQGAQCNPAADQFACGILAPNVGRIFRTVTASRQIQFALKISF